MQVAAGANREDPRTGGGARRPARLSIGLRYRVDGILHEYLGPAHLPEADKLMHVFLRNEWRRTTPGQLPLTLVDEAVVATSVTPTKIGDTDASRHRWMWSRG